MRRLAWLLTVLFLAGCSVPLETPDAATEIAALSDEISRLGTGVDETEAAQVARIAVTYSKVLRDSYIVTDGPLVHNTKVNLGIRPRGLCWHWADDLEARLRAEGFETVTLHRAIANSDNSFRIEHSTVIVSAKGARQNDGIVLDPWRFGGILFWSRVPEDTDYNWIPRQDVFAERRRRTEPL